MGQTFVSWVEPFAAQYRASRVEAVAVAGSLTEVQLAVATGDEGWTVRDEIAHIAGSDIDFLHTFGGILRGESVDMSLFNDIDGRNARNLAENAPRPMTEIARMLQENGDKLLELLAQLGDDDESRQPAGMPFPLRGLVEGYGQHEPHHLGQVRDALANMGAP